MKISLLKGFTLVELIIALAVACILAAVALPDYRTFTAQRRLNGAARQVMSDLTAARMQAITLSRDVHVTFSTTYSNQYVIDATGAGITKNIGTTYEDVTVKASLSPVVFHPDGASSNLVIKVLNTLGDKTITISRIGRIKIN